jgi:hypothetical protein
MLPDRSGDVVMGGERPRIAIKVWIGAEISVRDSHSNAKQFIPFATGLLLSSKFSCRLLDASVKPY